MFPKNTMLIFSLTMKLKIVFISILSIIYPINIAAQKIDFENIDSKNALQLIATQIPPDIQNVDFQSFIIQIGNKNWAQLELNRSSEISLLQEGFHNYTYFNNRLTNEGSSMNIQVQGSNNIVDITGSNSISDNMKIKISGDNKTIFMRNY